MKSSGEMGASRARRDPQRVHSASRARRDQSGRYGVQGQKARVSRRKMLGMTALGLAGAGAVAGGGVAAAQLWQSGALRGIFGGAATSNMQIGHLLRRAGFGVRPEEV